MPLVHFLAGGALLFGAVHGPAGSRPDAPTAPVVITAADVAHLRRAHARDAGVEPSALDETGLVDRAIDEEVLFREALARGLDHDRSVRNWLVEQMRVLDPDAPDDPDGLYARARALGLDRTDLVVRRMLVQKMRLVASRAGEASPSDDQLRALYARDGDEYRLPERVTLWHVFVAGRGGADAAAGAAALLAAFRRDGTAPAEAVRHGDTCAAPPYLRSQSGADLDRRFGAGFAAAVAGAPAGAWSGPVLSAYGAHLVWVEARIPGARPPLDAVRGRLRERWLAEERARRLADTVRALRARQPLLVESAAWRERSPS